MARVGFILDKLFRKIGLSGKSFIPMLIGTGCGVPGIMASRTIESDRDRKMTIITTTFIPCSAKLPLIGLIAGALLGGAWWVAPCAYFLGIGAVVLSGLILKKTKLFFDLVFFIALNIKLQAIKKHDKNHAFSNMVGTERLELSRIAALEPKSSASTNFATSPDKTTIRI